MLDIIGSFLIGLIVTLIMLNLKISSTQSKFSSDTELKLQLNAKTVADMMSYDLRKIGYNYTGTAIITASEKQLTYYCDIDKNGTPDIITYALSDSTIVTATSNPKDKILYRIVNNDTSKGPSLGITNIRFTYKKADGTITSNRAEIKFIKVEIWFEAAEKIDDKYPFTYWELVVRPRNI